MIYLVDSNEDKYEILDMDDLTLEHVTRKEINQVLKSGLKLSNVDTDIVLQHPRTRLQLNRMAAIGGTRLYKTKPRGYQLLDISSVLVFERNIFITNREHNFILQYTYQPMKSFLLLFQGLFYNIELRQSSSKSASFYNSSTGTLFINDKQCFTLGWESNGFFPVYSLGYYAEKDYFKIKFRECTVYIKNGVIDIISNYGKKHVCEEGLGKSMSEAEYKRYIMFV